MSETFDALIAALSEAMKVVQANADEFARQLSERDAEIERLRAEILRICAEGRQ